MSSLVLSIDGHGGDAGLSVVIPAVAGKALEHPNITFDVSVISGSLLPNVPRNVSFTLAESVIEADMSASEVLRHQQHSTMGKVLQSVANGRSAGCLTAGSTVALVALSRHYIDRLDRVKKVALIKPMPSGSYLLDLGANVNCTASDLVSFARMGEAYYATNELDSPAISLLNVGREPLKGGRLIQEAHALFRASNMNYAGFVEADEIFNISQQVIVCDGFTGNIALKSGEGLARYLLKSLSSTLPNSSELKSVLSLVSHSQYNGACLLGVDGLIMKSHGGANVQGFSAALDRLVEQACQNTHNRFKALLS
ncbi:hypothetical protein N9J26_00210 [bacterium]|nr:hypothetical protein [bacterium]